MPRRDDIKSILVLGSGPIVIGQACEFDYSGTQACRVLRQEGYRVILANSNPATIMTDPDFADRTYIEPLTPDFIEKIIEREKPDAVLPKLAELKYRAMNNFDLGAVLEIEKELFPDPWNLAQFKEELAGVPKTRTYFVVEIGATQKVVGFAGLYCPGGGADADIQTISVSAQYQGNGIGQGLLDLLISVAIERNAPAVFLEVRAENEQARALYAKNGFTQISVRKNYYQNAQPRSKYRVKQYQFPR